MIFALLVRYDTCKARAATHLVDEFTHVHDKATALLAKQAGDYDLQNKAAEIRLLAERAGELRVDIQASKQRQAREHKRPRKASSHRSALTVGPPSDCNQSWVDSQFDDSVLSLIACLIVMANTTAAATFATSSRQIIEEHKS
jgi:hypothetical protein